MSKEIKEVQVADETDLEVAEDKTGNEYALDSNGMDSVIAVSKKIESYEKALNMIRNFILRTSYAGDWVCHSRGDVAVNMRSANLSASGCERAAVALGITEANWKEFPKEWSDDRKHYGFRYEADFTFGGRTVHTYGEASTRNKFFSYEKGNWKEINDVREDHIRKAAYRDCHKNGIVKLLGIRKIPLLKLQELGFNLDLVHFVSFKSAKEAVQGIAALPPPKDNGVPKISSGEVVIIPGEISEERKSKTGNPFYWITDIDREKYTVFSAADGDRLKTIRAAIHAEQKLRVKLEIKGDFKNIVEILEVIQ